MNGLNSAAGSLNELHRTTDSTWLKKQLQETIEKHDAERAETKNQHVRNFILHFNKMYSIPFQYPWRNLDPQVTPDQDLTNTLITWIEHELGGKTINDYGKAQLTDRLAFNNNGHSINGRKLNLHQFIQTDTHGKLTHSNHEQLKALASALTYFECNSFKPTPDLQLLINRCSPYAFTPRKPPRRPTRTGLNAPATINFQDSDVTITFSTPEAPHAFAELYQLPKQSPPRT